MIKREYVKAVIAGKETGVTPYFIDLTSLCKQKVADYYLTDIDSVNRIMGNYMLFLKYTEPDGFVAEKLEGTCFKDEFGILWDEEKGKEIGDWGIVDHPVKDMDLGDYEFPSGKSKGRFKKADKLVSDNPDCFNLLQMNGIFDTAWHIIGIQDMLMGMALDSDFTDNILDKALEYNLEVIDQLPEYIDGVRFIEDWGDQKCLMMGPKYWRMFLKPRLKLMYEACRKKGVAVFIHSCGNITELFPDLIEIGVDVADPIQPEVMDLEFIKREYGQDVVLFGGIGCQSIIPLGTPEEIVTESRKKLEMLSKGGKYIFGSAGAIPTDTPIENIVALIRFCKEMVMAG